MMKLSLSVDHRSGGESAHDSSFGRSASSRWRFSLPLTLALLCLTLGHACAQFTPALRSAPATRGDELLTEYLRQETALLSERCLSEIETAEDWHSVRDEYRRQLQEMLGLWPMPARTDLKPVVTGQLDHPEFTVEKLQFQASPGLYCTANLYLPKGLTEPAPTILYECGHWKLVTNGISMGNKAVYQIDGAWFARNGYICLVMDTLLAGEIQGIHTGTRDHNLWWWNSRGYTPAGVEAWFGMRALDYLCTRSEVDTNRFGITGHSGGGAYSWTVTALDDRIQVAAPLAGMTDLSHHVVDNLMDSHCDCNFPINVHRWDFPQLAAMAAPRPLLIGGTDRDGLFPLQGTIDIHRQVSDVYRLLNASDKLGLAIAPGSHDEVPELRLAVMRWFNQHLRGLDKRSEPPILVEVKRIFTPQQLRVFDELPTDSINQNIADTFVPMAAPQTRSAEELRQVLRDTVFTGWPDGTPPPKPKALFSVERELIRLSAWEFLSQNNLPLRIYLLENASGGRAETTELRVLDEAGWTTWVETVGSAFADTLKTECATRRVFTPNPDAFDRLTKELSTGSRALAYVAPRGVGLSAWSGDMKRITRIRRRFMLMGQTVDSMRVWDISRTVQALRSTPLDIPPVLDLHAEGTMAVNALYAALFEPDIRELNLVELPQSQSSGPDYLGVLKVTDLPEILNAVSSHTTISLEP